MAQQQIEGTSHRTDDPHQEEKQRRYLRIFFLIIVALWLLAAITLPVVAFCITKNPFCLTGVGGIAALLPARYILRRVTDYLFMDKRMVELEKTRIEQSKDNPHNKPIPGTTD